MERSDGYFDSYFVFKITTSPTAFVAVALGEVLAHLSFVYTLY